KSSANISPFMINCLLQIIQVNGMDKNPFQEASEIIERLEKEGYEAYFVGGCVRDLLLQRKIEDIDIATSASPPIVQQTFQTVIPVGIEHGTVIVRHKGKSYEVTTFRRDIGRASCREKERRRE